MSIGNTLKALSSRQKAVVAVVVSIAPSKYSHSRYNCSLDSQSRCSRSYYGHTLYYVAILTMATYLEDTKGCEAVLPTMAILTMAIYLEDAKGSEGRKQQ